MNVVTNGKPTMSASSRPPVLKPPLKPSPAPPALPRPEPREIPEPDRAIFEKSRTESLTLRFLLNTGEEIQAVVVRHGKFSVLVTNGRETCLLYKHGLQRVALLEA